MNNIIITPSLRCPYCGNASLATYDIIQTTSRQLTLDLADEMTGLTIYCDHCKKEVEVDSIIVNYRGGGFSTYS